MVYTVLASAVVALFYGYATLVGFLGYNVVVELKAKNFVGATFLGGLGLVASTVLAVLVYTFYA